MGDQESEHTLRTEYQTPNEFLSREVFFGEALPKAFEDGPFSLIVIRENNWKQHSLGAMPSVLRHIDQHVLREVPMGSSICRPLLMNAVAVIARLSRDEALLLAQAIVARVAAEPLTFPWLPDEVRVHLSGAVYDSGTWPNPALLAFMTGDLSRAAPAGTVLPPL
jgi:hypothetical protein